MRLFANFQNIFHKNGVATGAPYVHTEYTFALFVAKMYEKHFVAQIYCFVLYSRKLFLILLSRSGWGNLTPYILSKRKIVSHRITLPTTKLIN